MGDTFSLTQKMINSLHLTWTRLPLTRGAAPNVPSATTLGLSIGPAPPGIPRPPVSPEDFRRVAALVPTPTSIETRPK